MAQQVNLEKLKTVIGELLAKEFKDSFNKVSDLEYSLEAFYEDFLVGNFGTTVYGDSLQFIESEGGGEGGAEECSTIIKLDGLYYRINYSYYSHDGYDFSYSSAYLVTPQQRLTTYYV